VRSTKRNLPSPSEEEIKVPSEKVFGITKQFFEKEQLCKVHFWTQANRQEDKIASFSFHRNSYFIVESYRVYTPKIKPFNNFFRLFKLSNKKNYYHSQTLLLSFQVVERRVKIEDRKLQGTVTRDFHLTSDQHAKKIQP
jgi:hypothetical protein